MKIVAISTAITEFFLSGPVRGRFQLPYSNPGRHSLWSFCPGLNYDGPSGHFCQRLIMLNEIEWKLKITKDKICHWHAKRGISKYTLFASAQRLNASAMNQHLPLFSVH